MFELTVCKADGLGVDDDVESVKLSVSGDLTTARRPGLPLDYVFNEDAETVMKALRHLPQGTKHRLLILMLRDKMVSYRGV